MENNINALDEISKGCCMGIDALDFILDKAEEPDFVQLLNEYKEHYESLSKKIEKTYTKYSDKEPHETTKMAKAMTWYGIQMNTLTDKSTSKLAEILLEGTTMGIAEGRKILNNKNIANDIEEILSEFVNMQEKFCETLKNYL